MPRPPLTPPPALALALVLAALAAPAALAASAAIPAAPSPMPEAVAASIAAYDGKCPCPYTIKANGKPCAGASAWSRPGGKPILCFADDVGAALKGE